MGSMVWSVTRTDVWVAKLFIHPSNKLALRLNLCPHWPCKVAKDRRVVEVERVTLVVSQYPREDGVLVKVIVRSTSELIEPHQVLKVGQLAPVPRVLQLVQELTKSCAVAIAIAVVKRALALQPSAHMGAQPLALEIEKRNVAGVVEELQS